MLIKLDGVKLRELVRERNLTQAELVRLSGVSRVTVARLLKAKAPRIHAGTLLRLQDALGLPAKALPRDAIVDGYLESVRAKNATLDFTGLGIVTADQEMPMDRGFVPLKVSDIRDEQPCNVERGITKRPRHGAKPFSLASALSRSQHAFLLGDPGSGKTTVLRHLALVYARRQQCDYAYPPENLIPILVRLPEWAEQLRDDEGVDLIAAAVSQLSVANEAETAAWLRRQTDPGNVLVLLDGLDEVPDPHVLSRLLEQIREFVRGCCDARLVITSRSVGFDAPNLGVCTDVLELKPLEDQAIEDFAAQWCAWRHGHKSARKCAACEKRTATLRSAVLDHPRVRTLAGNPMMLTILCLLHDAGAALPQRRWQLYEKISEAFLFTWQEKKRTAMAGAPDATLALEDREILWMLESLALEMQRHDWTLVPRWWLARHACAFLRDELGLSPDQARREADTLVWSLQERSGLLVERGAERYAFRHLAYQEHFAARAVLSSTDPDPIETIRPYVYHPRWREVVRLLAAQLDRKRGLQLLGGILDDPDPTGRFLRRGLLLVLECLTDGASIHGSELLDELRVGIEELGKTKWLGLAMEAIESLVTLRDSRYRDFARTALDDLLLAAEDNDESDVRDVLRTVADMVGHGLLEADVTWEPDQPNEDDAGKPFFERMVESQGRSFAYTISTRREQSDSRWAAAVLKQLRSDESDEIREACADELGRFARRSMISRGLIADLDTQPHAEVRAAIATALATVAHRGQVRQALMTHLDGDQDLNVRGACAAALRKAACFSDEIRRRLIHCLEHAPESELREGAARGLSRSARRDVDVRTSLLSIVGQLDTAEKVRVACLHSLHDVLPTLPDGAARLTQLLGETHNGLLSRVAAQIFADYAATGRVDWSSIPIEQVEQVLVSVKDPCRHALEALRGLVDAREIRQLGVPMERRIERALSNVRERIEQAFVFGSRARREQSGESDVDLMIIGDTSLKDLTPSLKTIEQELGCQVNAVIYSPNEWQERIRESNPFVKEVSRGKKLFVIGEPNELAAMA